MRMQCAIGLAVLAVSSAGAAPDQEEMIPLIDLGTGCYMGAEGGLYPGGANTPPPAHLAAALSLAQQIVPRGPAGQPNEDGLIGMVSIGMSNANQEFGAFSFVEDQNPDRNARVVIVNAAQGGQDSKTIADPEAPYWQNVLAKVEAAGLTPAQVQTAWLKEAKAFPTGDFPEHALLLEQELGAIARNIKAFFPNVQICYLSSRTYGGFAQGSLNPEPFAYESGFSVKWLIEDQINGSPALNYGQLPGDAVAPLLLWGPYLWANGTTPNGQGLAWFPEDFESDGVHPSASGEQKVASRLSQFFSASPSAQAWWPKQGGSQLLSIPVTDDAHVLASQPDANFGAAATLLTGGEGSAQTYLRFDASGVSLPIAYAKLALRVDEQLAGGGVDVVRVPNTDWEEESLTFATAPGAAPGVVSAVPALSRGGNIAARVTQAVVGDADGVVSFALAPQGQGGPLRAQVAKEGAQGPRLVLTLVTPCPGDFNGDGDLDVFDFIAFQQTFMNGGPAADLNDDGLLNVLDFIALQSAFDLGCL